MPSQKDLHDINHFYYCFLVALRLRVRYRPLESGTQRKRFMVDWLLKAKREKFFARVVCAEINWLVEETLRLTAVYEHIEQKVARIYEVTAAIIFEDDISDEGS